MLRVLGDGKLPVLPNVWLGASVESERYTGRIDLLRRVPAHVRFISFEPLVAPVGKVNLSDIHWAIVGGESGPRARPMEKKWVDEISRQCRAQRVAFFFKQWGGVNKKAAGRTYRDRTWDEYPAIQLEHFPIIEDRIRS
jgi:protein gp37